MEEQYEVLWTTSNKISCRLNSIRGCFKSLNFVLKFPSATILKLCPIWHHLSMQHYNNCSIPMVGKNYIHYGEETLHIVQRRGLFCRCNRDMSLDFSQRVSHVKTSYSYMWSKTLLVKNFKSNTSSFYLLYQTSYGCHYNQLVQQKSLNW